MLQLIVYIIAGFSICVIINLGVIKLIRMWTGCSDNEAVAKLQRFVNGTPVYRIEEDIGLQNEIWENVKKVIGEKRYNQLVDLNSTAIIHNYILWELKVLSHISQYRYTI